MKLELKNLSAAYDRTPILRGLNTQVGQGEFIGLIGPNGSGKSCLLKTIAGILKPIAGDVILDGDNVHAMSAKSRARKISYLAQDRTANWPLPVDQLVALGRAPYRGSLGKLSTQDELAIAHALNTAHCIDLKTRRFDQLSGGEQMRVHLARALAVDAPLLIADEPNTALDPYYQITLMETLSSQIKAGKTVIASLHDLSLAKQFCTRIWVVHAGELVQDAAPDQALSTDILAQVFNIKRSGANWTVL